jgi:hypothetical protein
MLSCPVLPPCHDLTLLIRKSCEDGERSYRSQPPCPGFIRIGQPLGNVANPNRPPCQGPAILRSPIRRWKVLYAGHPASSSHKSRTGWQGSISPWRYQATTMVLLNRLRLISQGVGRLPEQVLLTCGGVHAQELSGLSWAAPLPSLSSNGGRQPSMHLLQSGIYTQVYAAPPFTRYFLSRS